MAGRSGGGTALWAIIQDEAKSNLTSADKLRVVVDTVSRGGNGELATALTLGAENGGDKTAAVETLLAAASLGVSLCDAPFLLHLACWLNRARRKERGKQGGEGGPSPVAALRAAVLQRVVEDAATTMPPFSQLDTLDMSAPELAHELLVWLLAEDTFSSYGGEVTSGGKGSDGGFASLPPFLASVLLGWLMRKPELLLPLAVGGSDDSDVTEVPTAHHSETNTDVWSSSLALVLRVVRHAVSAALNPIQAPHNVAVALHEAALRALASAASEADVLSRVAVGAPAGLPAVARSVGPCVWPSEQYVLLLQSLPPVAVRGGMAVAHSELTIRDLIEMPLAVALSLRGSITPTGAAALGAALSDGADAMTMPEFTSYLLECLSARSAEPM